MSESVISLSKKELIDYHKDKTNSEYLYEIENNTMRTQFSYLSYVYSYVWYGEFPVDETNFKVAENKYQSFLFFSLHVKRASVIVSH